MFKRFSPDTHTSSNSKVKSSVQRTIRAKILEQYPALGEIAEEILPKKAPMVLAKCQNHIQIVIHDGIPLFFNVRDGPFLPTLRLLHKLPDLMKNVTADKGAIPFVLAGANIMCPGLTSAGGDLSTELNAGEPVAILAEGKKLPMAVGWMELSTADIREKNQGVAIEMGHFLGDDLWKLEKLD